MDTSPYRLLAERLDALPNGFPSTPDGAELRLLAKLFTSEEAALAANLRLTLETPRQLAARLAQAGLAPIDPGTARRLLKSMARKGLINAGKTRSGLGYGLMPFVVGFYEEQNGRMDAELAQLFEAYFIQAFPQLLGPRPALHRVVPVDEAIRVDLEFRPLESAGDLVRQAQAWGVLACICRTQKALIGQACRHPLDNCMVLSHTPGIFDNHPLIKALTLDQALETLHQAAQAGLVHSVSNVRQEVTYICNCCTCSCGILRGAAQLGAANVVARSAYLSQVDPDRCQACGSCLSACPFEALSLPGWTAVVDRLRCVGCGLCTQACPEQALSLALRPAEEVLPVPQDTAAWQAERARWRGIDLTIVL
jgi:electron transport complex protein RnfB